MIYTSSFQGLLSLSAATAMGIVIKRCKLPKRVKVAAMSFLTLAYVQTFLGILTLLNHVPTYLAAMHQSGSLLLLSSIVWLSHEAKLIKKCIKYVLFFFNL